MTTAVSYFTDISILFLLDKTGLFQLAQKNRDYICRQKNGRCRARLFLNLLGSNTAVPLYNLLGFLSQIVPEPRLQDFTRLAFLSTEMPCQALRRFCTISRPNGPFDLEYDMTLGETLITKIDTALLSLTESCSFKIKRSSKSPDRR